MRSKKAKTAAVLSLLLALTLAACDKKTDEPLPEKSSDSAEHIIHENSDRVKSYSFPQFLEGSPEADMLSNAVFKSFDPAQLMVEPEKQPFSDYKCTACFDGKVYIFKQDENYGLLDMAGGVLVEADGIKKISAAAVDLLQIKYEDGSTAYFHVDDKGGEFSAVGEFLVQRIGFRRNEASEEYPESCYTITLDGNDIYTGVWDSVSQVDSETLDTSKKYEAVFKAESPSGAFYVCFDSFYNFAVYEAAYGFISLKVGGEYGECYIVNGDDYDELVTLISSFGREDGADMPSKDENEDFIQITLGLSGGEKTVITVSADGYCLTDKSGENGASRFFSVMSRETFADLISWVDSALGAEYQ